MTKKSTMPGRGFKPRALGEIAIRVADMARMADFYETVLGLERLRGTDADPIVFFRIGEGFGGHTAVLALFAQDAPANLAQYADATGQNKESPVTGLHSSLHHIALSLPFREQDAVMAWYDRQGIDYSVQHFGWIGWRGVFTKDPEGNTVELVAYDPAMLDENAQTGA